MDAWLELKIDGGRAAPSLDTIRKQGSAKAKARTSRAVRGDDDGGGNDTARHKRSTGSSARRSQALVQSPLHPGTDCHRPRRDHRLVISGVCQERLDQGDGRRLRQAHQDGHRADHLLHRRLGHRPHFGGAEGRPRRGQGARLFRDRLDLRARLRPHRRQRPSSRRGVFRQGRCRGGGDLCQASKRNEVRRLRPTHHPRFRGRRLCAG